MIVMIAILAGMLLPALNSAREKACSIACTANFKQCGLYFAQYADMFTKVTPHPKNAPYP